MSEESSEYRPAQKRSKKPMHLGNTLDDQQAADTAANYTLGPGHSVTDPVLKNRCPHGNKNAYSCKKCHNDAVSNGTAEGRMSRYCIPHGKPKSSCNGGTCQTRILAEPESESTQTAPMTPPEQSIVDKQSIVDTQMHLTVTGVQCQFCSDFNASPESRLCSNCIKSTAMQGDIQAISGSNDLIAKQIAANICVHGSKKAYFCRECKNYAAKIGMKKKFAFCDHDRQKNSCKECGSSSLCEHDRQKSKCVECGGSGVCEHSEIKSMCKTCKENNTGGGNLCDHDRLKSTCKDCRVSSICEHSRSRSVCKECKENGTGGGSLCDHDRIKSKCKECKINGTGGGSFCDHDRIKSKCQECKESGVGGGSRCDHGRIKSICKECVGASICKHSKYRRVCRECKENGIGGSSLCDHGKINSVCKECKENGIGGSSICDHDEIKSRCKECKKNSTGGSNICDHARIKSICKECKENGTGGAGLCDHNRRRTRCRDCGDPTICKHIKHKQFCKDCGGSGLCRHDKVKYSCTACKSLGLTYGRKKRPRDGVSFCYHGIECKNCEKCRESCVEFAKNGPIQSSVEFSIEPSTLEDWDITGDLGDEGFDSLIQCPQCHESKDYSSFVPDECGMPSLYCQVCTKVINEGRGILCSGGCRKFLFGQDASLLSLCQNCTDQQAMDDDSGLRPFGELDEHICCFNCSQYLPITSFSDDVDRENMPYCIECKVLIDRAAASSADHAEHSSSASGY